MNLQAKERLAHLRARLAAMDEHQVLCEEARIRDVVELGFAGLEACDERLKYLERFSFTNITKLANDLRITPPEGKCP